jgi:hypothetical protein
VLRPFDGFIGEYACVRSRGEDSEEGVLVGDVENDPINIRCRSLGGLDGVALNSSVRRSTYVRGNDLGMNDLRKG